jgi:hypothetical protein
MEVLLGAYPGAVAVSAHTGEGVDRLQEELERMLRAGARAEGAVPGDRTGRGRGSSARAGGTPVGGRSARLRAPGSRRAGLPMVPAGGPGAGARTAAVLPALAVHPAQRACRLR